MIELRWDKRIVMDHNAPIGGSVEKVLQYRYRFPNRYNDFRDYPPEKWEWSDWIDVEG